MARSKTDKSPDPNVSITNLELVDWVDSCDCFTCCAKNEGERVESMYTTFDEAYSSILKKGQLVISKQESQVDLTFTALGGRYDGALMAIRRSGRSFRRFLIDKESFGECFHNFDHCIHALQSNNVVENRLEIQHLRDIAEKLKIDPQKPECRIYHRPETDIFSSAQLLSIYDEMLEEDPENKEAISFLFSLGFSVGRLFSSIQSTVTLEPDADLASQYRESYKSRGKKSGSDKRKETRLKQMMAGLERLQIDNAAIHRFPPTVVARIVVDDLKTKDPALWSQGAGQIDAYLTILSSEPEFKTRFDAVFFPDHTS